MFGKRGINGIIVSVLLVLLALAAVGILWTVLHLSVERSGESVSSQTDDLIDQVFSLGLNNSNGTNSSEQILCSLVSDCGTNGLSGNNYCSNGDVFRNFVNWTCNNPGQNSSSCSSISTPQLIENCEFLCSDGVCTNLEFSYLRTFFASPNGNGNGSLQSPFNISAFWNIPGGVQPGDALILLDGVYTGNHGMIKSPAGVNGNSGNPITIRALNDGEVWIDGEGARAPIALGSDIAPANWFVIEGVNAFNSSSRVVNLGGSNNIIRRVVAWDARNQNDMVFSINYGLNNLVEDSAGFGTARKVFESYYSNQTTFRRTWGRWEKSYHDGPKMTYAMAYESRNLLAENAIGTANAIGMEQTYTLIDSFGNPAVGDDCNPSLPGIQNQCTNYEVYNWNGIFGYDRMIDDKATNSKIIGSIAYMTGNELRVNGINGVDDAGFVIAKVANYTVENSVSYFGGSMINQPFILSRWGSWKNNTFYQAVTLGGTTNDGVVPTTDNGHYYVTLDGGVSALLSTQQPIWPVNGGFVNDGGVRWWDRGLMNNNAKDLTGIGTTTSAFVSWNITETENGASSATAFGAGQTLFNNDGTGAEICYRYENGVLTNEPLWPWPMEQRIVDAMAVAGRTPVNVTQTIIDMFGPIPPNCLSG